MFDFLYYFPEEVSGISSGFVIQKDGYILTNHHVVERAREVSVTFSDGRTFNVTDVARDVLVDRQTDLAVIKIEVKDLPVSKFGDSDKVIIGEWAISIGNPFGLLIEDPKPTLTVGVVSAVDRNFRPDDGGHIYQEMIQTDASINPGNSGGFARQQHWRGYRGQHIHPFQELQFYRDRVRDSDKPRRSGGQ